MKNKVYNIVDGYGRSVLPGRTDSNPALLDIEKLSSGFYWISLNGVNIPFCKQ